MLDNKRKGLGFRTALSGLALLACLGVNKARAETRNYDLSGATNIVTTNVTQDASIEIHRTPEYKFIATAGENGSVSGNTNGWAEAGQTTEEIVFNPNEFYFLSEVYTNGTYVGNSLTNNFLVSGVLNIEGKFEPILTEKGTPHYWLAEKELGFDDNFVTNNYALWQHYQLDTNPHDKKGYFQTAIEPGNLVLKNTSTNVVYGVNHTLSLSQPSWQNYTNNVSGQIGETRIPLLEKGFYQGNGRRKE